MKATPQTITLIAVGIILIPRLLSGAALGPGTISIILFWIGILVLLPESIKEFSNEKLNISNLPFLTKYTILTCCIYSTSLIFLGETLYDGAKSPTTIVTRRILSLMHPIICLSWYPLVQESKRKHFIYQISLLTLFSILAQGLTHILGGTNTESYITKTTAFLAGGFIEIFTNNEIFIEQNSYFFKSHEIKIGAGCASIPQVGLAIQCIGVFMISCPLKSYFNLVSIGIISIIIAMFINSLRVGLLGIALVNFGEATFDFWHSGIGSLVFSFVIMTIVSCIYYFYWKFDHD